MKQNRDKDEGPLHERQDDAQRMNAVHLLLESHGPVDDRRVRGQVDHEISAHRDEAAQGEQAIDEELMPQNEGGTRLCGGRGRGRRTFHERLFPEKTPPKHATGRQKLGRCSVSIRGAGYLASQLESARVEPLAEYTQCDSLPKWQLAPAAAAWFSCSILPLSVALIMLQAVPDEPLMSMFLVLITGGEGCGT